MRRTKQEIKSIDEIESLIQRAQVCPIGLSDGIIPYVVPVYFGYRRNYLFFHGASEGKKLEIIRRNSNVCFEMDTDHQIVKQEGPPCGCSGRYYSIIGFGKASIVDHHGDKSSALSIINEHYDGEPYDFSDKEMESVTVVKIDITSMTGKKSGY